MSEFQIESVLISLFTRFLCFQPGIVRGNAAPGCGARHINRAFTMRTRIEIALRVDGCGRGQTRDIRQRRGTLTANTTLPDSGKVSIATASLEE